jgi:hypothetical protein
MLGLNGGGCGECNACAKVAPCEKACTVKACDPCVKVKACEPACNTGCNNGCGKVKKYHATPVRDLFDNVKDLFEAKGCIADDNCGEAKGCCPEPACKPVACRKVRCEKACNPCEPACKAACEPVCEAPKPKCHKLYRRPVVELLENMFGCNKCNNCGEVGCDNGCGGTTVPGKTVTPGKAPEAAAPLPAAPKADTKDPSASIQKRGIYQASRSLVRN